MSALRRSKVSFTKVFHLPTDRDATQTFFYKHCSARGNCIQLSVRFLSSVFFWWHTTVSFEYFPTIHKALLDFQAVLSRKRPRTIFNALSEVSLLVYKIEMYLLLYNLAFHQPNCIIKFNLCFPTLWYEGIFPSSYATCTFEPHTDSHLKS